MDTKGFAQDLDKLIANPPKESRSGEYDAVFESMQAKLREAVQKNVPTRALFEAFKENGGKLAFKTFSKKLTAQVGRRRSKRKKAH